MSRKNLWAPWRIKYVQGLGVKKEGCFICSSARDVEKDTENFVLLRTDDCLVMLNKFPYNNGHLLIAPKKHVSEIGDLDDAGRLELMNLVVKFQKILSELIKPQGFNVGINLGRCAGAGVPGHLHVHVVPRWQGDTNFMESCAETGVISQSMTRLYEKIKAAL